MSLKEQISSDSHFFAYLQAIRDAPGAPKPLDWQILTVLGNYNRDISFNIIYTTFNKSQQTHSNHTYYAAINRLTAKGFVKQGYNSKGWRLWSITPAGKHAIAQMNEIARKYL